MLTIILIGSAMIIATVFVESCFIALAVVGFNRYGDLVGRLRFLPRMIIVLSVLTLWLLAGISVALWLWAALFLQLGEFDSLADAIHFSSVSATTLGYGDLLLSERWQLLSGFIAANGLVLFSLNTAFLFEVLRMLNAVSPGAGQQKKSE